MTRKTLLLFHMVVLILFSAACQKISTPEDVEVVEIPPPAYQDVIPEHVGEYVRFYAEIEFTYRVLCDEQINDDDACPLFIHETAHIINIILGLNKNNVTTSSKIIFSDGATEEADIFGRVPAMLTALVKECDDKKACVLDVYQIDKPKE